MCVCVLLFFCFLHAPPLNGPYFAALSQISQPEFAIKKTRTHSNHSAGRLTCTWGVCHNASHTRPSCCALRTAVTTTTCVTMFVKLLQQNINGGIYENTRSVQNNGPCNHTHSQCTMLSTAISVLHYTTLHALHTKPSMAHCKGNGEGGLGWLCFFSFLFVSLRRHSMLSS